ncbi:MAG: TetR/AcrR family transcriptional regulator [Myxococcales bacterium]|nr:TetR/AcrR family transcriptional regulator [Myxococcales bacterium]
MDTRTAILDEAERIVLTEGHEQLRVTTVARRLEMSHANVYRYFPNRQALVEAVARRHMAIGQAAVRTVLQAPGSASERLENAAVALAEHKLAQQRNGAHRVVAMVLSEAPELATTHFAAHAAWIAAVLQEGTASGELAVHDPQGVACTLIDALAAVHHPALAVAADPERLVARARAIMALCLTGLVAPRR